MTFRELSIHLTCLLSLVAACAVSHAADERIGESSENAAVGSFTNDINPIFTKLGCNGGGCHGKSGGRGGFQLSLFGFDSPRDYDSVSRGSRGRRLFFAAPEESLLLKKATMKVPHGGGRRMNKGDQEYITLRNWIKNNAPWQQGDLNRLVELSVRPDKLTLAPNAESQIQVIAHYANGQKRDVTRLARYKSIDPGVATVSDLGKVDARERLGETPVVAQYQGLSVISRIRIPSKLSDAVVAEKLKQFPVVNFIDVYVKQKLNDLRLVPSAVVNDATFLRRATLQISGRLPTLKQTKQFLDNPSTSKRAELINALLSSGAYADHFAQKWSDLLRNKRRGQKARIPGTIAFHRWIRNSIAANIPYDEFVRRVITASGNVTANPPAQWYAEVRYLDRYVDDTAQVFLGLRIGCARCHHHPFEKFSQDDYFGLAAFFAKVDRKGGAGVAERRADETVYVKLSGKVKHPVTGNVVAPKGLGSPELSLQSFEDPRHHLVDWMVDAKNPYFARAFVNRMWSHFFGRGLVEPMDDMRVTNPATIEPLLNELATKFVESGYDMKQVIRLICSSSTYQLDSRFIDARFDESKLHSRFYPQRLTAEVLLDAMDQATGTPTRYSGLPLGTRASQLPDEDYSNEFLRLFGRPKRESACECERSAEPSLSQSLFVLNNSFILGKANSAKGVAKQLAKQKTPLSERIDDLFLTVLVRRPTSDERKSALEYIKSEKDAAQAFANLLWALVNTKEFLYVH